MSFVSVQVDTSPTDLLDTGIDAINATLAANGLPGWSAGDATLAVIVLSAVADLIADGTLVAATALPAIFRAFGTQLLGIPYNNGAQASVLSTWTFTAPAPSTGYFIAGGTALIVDGYVFYTQADFTTAAGATTATILLVASQAGTLYNNLGGVNNATTLNDQIDWVSSVVTVGVTSGGVDQQDDTSYQNELTATLQLQAPRPLVAADFAGMVLSELALNATGVIVGRATAIDGYFPDGRVLSTGGANIPTALSCTTVSGSPAVTLSSPPGNQVPAVGATVSGTGVASATFTATTTSGSPTLSVVSSFASVGVGTLVSGAGIPAGTSIIALPGGATATMSANATASAAGVTITPTQTVLGSPGPTESTFTMSANATASATNSLTFSALSGYGPTHLTCTATTANTSTTVTITTGPYPGAIPDVGARVRGAGIPAGTTVSASPAPTASSFTLSAAATASGSTTLTISSWTNVQAANCAFVTDANGNALSAASMDALANWLIPYRPQNWLTNVEGPSFTTIYVTCQIHVLPTYSPASVAAAVQTALLAYLNPASWGNQNAATGVNTWLNATAGFNVVRFNKVMGVIENVPGVDYVPTGQLFIGTAPSPGGTSDITLTGPAPLPTSTTTSVPLPTAV